MPRRYALMLSPDEAQRVGQKYMERRGAITDTMIARHLAGAIMMAVPTAIDHRAPCSHSTSTPTALRQFMP